MANFLCIIYLLLLFGLGVWAISLVWTLVSRELRYRMIDYHCEKGDIVEYINRRRRWLF